MVNLLGVTNSSVAVVARPDGRLVGVAATGGNFAASIYTTGEEKGSGVFD